MSETPEVEAIIEAAARSFCVGKEEVTRPRGRRGDQSVSRARAVAAYALRVRFGTSYPRLARTLGYKNHSSVLVAVRVVARAVAKDHGGEPDRVGFVARALLQVFPREAAP